MQLIYISKLFDDYVELGHKSKEDLIITGLGKIASQPVVIVAQDYKRSNSKETGKITIKDLSKINKFMNISEDFNIPIIFFVDNKGIDISYENELLGVGNILSKIICVVLRRDGLSKQRTLFIIKNYRCKYPVDIW